jgi:hypothetical protein
MTRGELLQRLEQEATRWQAKSFEELRPMRFPVVYEQGRPGSPDYFNTEVCLLELGCDSVHLSIAVDDGGASAFLPVSTSVIVTR